MQSRRPGGGIERIRIFYIIGTLDIGGAESQLVELVTRLDRDRFEPTVCCLSSAGGPLAERLGRADVPLVVLNLRGFREAGSYLRAVPHVARSIWRLFRAMRTTRPDIVQGVLFWAYLVAAYIGRAARVPTIVASRRSLGLFKAHKPAYLFLERIADRLTDLFIANSEAVRLDTIDREPIEPSRILVVHNGVDLRRFERPELVSVDLGSRPRVVVVANLIHYKGHEYFLRAWPEVIARFPTATAILIGDGPMRHILETLARELGIDRSLKFVGLQHDAVGFLAASDMVVHPSLQEGYSNAVLEAMAAGRAVVATSVGGNVEAVADGTTGILVAPADAKALAEGMLRVLENPALAADLGARAAASVRRRFSIESVVREYEAIYSKLVAGEPVRYEPTEELKRCAV